MQIVGTWAGYKISRSWTPSPNDLAATAVLLKHLKISFMLITRTKIGGSPWNLAHIYFVRVPIRCQKDGFLLLVYHTFLLKKRKKYFSRFSVEKSFSYDFAQTFTVTSKKGVLYPQFFSKGFYVQYFQKKIFFILLLWHVAPRIDGNKKTHPSDSLWSSLCIHINFMTIDWVLTELCTF